MTHTVITLASVATVGSAMLLWKLLTGESRGAVEEALQVQEGQEESRDGLSAEPSYSSFTEAAETAGSFANAETSTAWTDASSQYADEDTTGDCLSSKHSPSRQIQRQIGSAVHVSQHDEQAELLGSESYISAASAEDDSQEVFSSPAHSPAKQLTATSPQSEEDGVTAAPDTLDVPAERSALDAEPPQQVPAAGALDIHQQEGQQQTSLQQEEAWDPHSLQSEAQDSASLQQQQHQQQSADAQLAVSASQDAASSSLRHKRSSSSDQIAFGPIEPRFGLGGFLGQWDSAGTASVAERRASELAEQEQQQHYDDLAADEVDHEAPQSLEQGQHGQREQPLEQQQQVPDTLPQQQRLQQRKLQPLNFAAADTALQEQHAMTDSLWASLRTVEVPHEEVGSQVGAADEVTSPGRLSLPPRPPSAAGPAPAAGGAAERADSSDSEDYGQSSVTLPAEITSAVGPGTPRSNAAAAAAAPSDAGHSRQPSPRARAASGSLHGSLGDWPSIQLQSVPSDSTATQQTAQTGIDAATAVTPGKQSYSQSQQEHQPQQPPAAQVRDIQHQKPGHAASAGSVSLEHSAAQQQSVDQLHLSRTTAEPHEHAALHHAAELVQPLAETLPPSRWERQQQQQPAAEQVKQQQLVHLGDNSVAQQQPADDLQQPISIQQEPQAIHQPVNEPHQQLDKQPPQEQQRHAYQHQQPLLLQSEFTLPAPAGNSPNTYHANSISRKQQHYWKQQLQQGQQQRLVSDQPVGQPTGAKEPGPIDPAASRQSSTSQMLHAADTGNLHGSTSSSSSRPGHQQLPTEAAVADRDNTGGSGELDPLLTDLAAGLTAPRNWRPSRGHQGSMVGTTHSNLSVMTTAADDKLLRLRSSLQRQQQQQEDQLHTAAVPSSSGASSAGNAAAAADVDGPWLRLVVSSGPAAGRSFHSRDRTAELVIGRSPLCWASIADQEISGKHACVSWSSRHHCWQVADAGSLNGTSHNGAAISKAGREQGQPVFLTHGDKLDLGSITSAVVECSSGQRHEAAAGQQQQHDALGQAARAPDPAAVDTQQSQRQQQQGLADPICLQHQQQQGAELPPFMQPNQQQQQQGADSRYSTWTAGQARPTIASPSSSTGSNHRPSIDSPAAAAAAALHGTHGSAGISGNGSYYGGSSSSGSRSKRSSLLQTHYRTGGGLSSAGSSSCHGGSPSSPGGAVLAPLMLLQFLECRLEGAVAKMVGTDHRRNQMPCEDVVAWRTPLAHWPQIGLFCVFDGHHSRHASEQAQDLLPRLLSQHLQPTQQQQQHVQLPGQHDEHILQQQQQQQGALLANEPAVAAALTASFLETDKQLTCEDGCTATAVLLEGCVDGSVMLRVANVGDSMALLVDLANSGWRCLTEDHRIAGNAAEAARLSAKNNNVTGGVSTRLYGLNIARMLGDRFLKEQDVGFTAEPYVSEGVVLGPKDEMLVVVASDGLWDVVSQERAAGMAGKIAAERARAAGPSGAGTTAVDSTDSSAATPSSSGRVEGGMQDASGGNSSVAAAVAEALMHAALTLRSKDDISVMVLHVLPAAVAGRKAAAGSVTVSGSI